ncbi:MAG: molybdopterin-dependent oxidoreductase [Gammaproteobacteria bacterium]|nr:molybdopterin-dependent oxidoreductase [Gammaproteobacteria bacterium]
MSQNNHKDRQSFTIDRRQFLLLSAAGTATLVLGVFPTRATASNKSQDTLQPVAWIAIHPDNRIVFHMSKSEMGQGVTTALAMLVAEELHVDLAQLDVQQADFDPRYGDQNTGGSSSIQSNWQTLREAAAVTRELLLDAAAKRWSLSRDQCQAEQGQIHNRKTGDKLAYGDLVAIAQTLALPSHVTLKTTGFRVIGKSQPRVDLSHKINGSAVYGSDVKLDGMLTATVVHCPYFTGQLKSFDAKQALALAGVHGIFAIDRGIAVVAENYWTAQQAAGLLKIEWERSGDPILPPARYRDLLDRPGFVVEDTGTAPDLNGTKMVEAIYELPYQAHATMEPMTCTAYIHDGHIDIWAPTQTPANAYGEAMSHGKSSVTKFFDKLMRKVFHSYEDDIHIRVTQLGGGFGRRLQNDYVAEAVQIAKRVKKPVRLIWSREEDLQHDYYRPATTHKLTGHLLPDHSIASWQHKIVGGSINDYLWGGNGSGGDGSVTEGSTELAYAMAQRQVTYVKLASRVPLGFWRSVGNSHTAFAKECFVDELAHAAGIDPLQFRLQLLSGHPEQIAVLKLVADKAGWGKPLAPGRFHGLALHSCYGSHVAQIAEISIAADRRIRVHKVTCVMDCGIVVNPDGVRAQLESAVVYGLTATLKSAITLRDDKVEQSNFHDFPLLTMQETPQVDTYFVDTARPPAGVGEPGVPPIAPAVANAVFAASGQRLRQLPLRLPG